MPIAPNQPLLADIGELLGAIITLGAIIFWVIQKIAEANKAVQRRPVRPAAPAARAAAQGGRQPGGQQADPLRNQVEEFLRRANQGNPPRQAGAPARKPPAPVREIELLVDEVQPQTTRQTISAPLPPVGAQRTIPSLADRQQARRQAPPSKRKSLAEEADERAAARSKSIAQKVSHLGERIISEDRQFDDQLKAKFDHAVGTLAAETVRESAPDPRDSPAAQIATMLANPDGVRQAIVLNEILSRPTDRW
jgi:hypothetical protein